MLVQARRARRSPPAPRSAASIPDAGVVKSSNSIGSPVAVRDAGRELLRDAATRADDSSLSRLPRDAAAAASISSSSNARWTNAADPHLEDQRGLRVGDLRRRSGCSSATPEGVSKVQPCASVSAPASCAFDGRRPRLAASRSARGAARRRRPPLSSAVSASTNVGVRQLPIFARPRRPGSTACRRASSSGRPSIIA